MMFPKSGEEERGLLWRRIASYLDAEGSAETLASSASFWRAAKIAKGSLRCWGAEASWRTNWRVTVISAPLPVSALRVVSCSFRSWICWANYKIRKGEPQSLGVYNITQLQRENKQAERSINNAQHQKLTKSGKARYARLKSSDRPTAKKWITQGGENIQHTDVARNWQNRWENHTQPNHAEQSQNREIN